jgi:hypothetical protein
LLQIYSSFYAAYLSTDKLKRPQAFFSFERELKNMKDGFAEKSFKN